MKTMKTAIKVAVLLIIGGLIYCGLEIAWRGHTHWTMGVVGGICFVLIGGINEWFPWTMPLYQQGLIGAGIVTAAELVAGLILNVLLGLDIWDYSTMPLNFMGQICLPFCLLWILLSVVAVVLDDWLRYWIFGEERPHYVMR